MSWWARLNGDYAFHRKILEVGNEAAGAHARMIAFAAESHSSGKVARSAAMTIASQEVINNLLAGALLDRAGEDYIVHGFAEWNPTGADLAERRAELSAKRAEYGRRGGLARASKLPSNLASKEQSKIEARSRSRSRITSTSTEGEIAAAPPPQPEVRPKSKKEPKHTAEEIAAKERIVEVFVERFQSKKSARPDLSHEGEHKAAFHLVKAYGVDGACEIIRRAFEDTWIVTNGASLKVISAKANNWIGTAPRKGPIKQEDDSFVQEVLSGSR